jgi:PAS domain S-box-containing protein
MPHKGHAIPQVELRSLPYGPANSERQFSQNDDLFRKIFQSSSDAILLLSATASEFLDRNPRASATFGYARHEFLRLPPRRAICTLKDQWEMLLDSVRNRRDRWLRGMGCRPKSGTIIFCDVLPSVVELGGKCHVLATIRDARQRELAEASREDARFMRFSNAVIVGAAAASTIEHAIRFCLRQVCDYTHLVFAHAHIFSGRILAARVPVDIWHFGMHERAESVKAMITARRFGFPEEWYSHILANSQAVTADELEGQPEFLEKIELQNAGLSSVLAAPVLVGGEIAALCQYFSDEPTNRGQLFLDIMANLKARLGQIIEQKQADENVRNLSTRLFRAQDEERRQLARELHDTTAQNVAAILMDLGVISRNANALTDASNQALSESLALARQSLQELRSFSYLIHPPMLEELGLIAALRIFIEGFSQRSSMRVHLEAPDSCPKLATWLETTVFRVVQEGLTNARRHSGSSTADVRLKVNSTELRLSVENETTGELLWDQPDVQPGKFGVGMRSMQERVQYLGGHLGFHIGKNRTVLEVALPLSKATREERGLVHAQNPDA